MLRKVSSGCVRGADCPRRYRTNATETETFCLVFIWQKRFSRLAWCSLPPVNDFHPLTVGSSCFSLSFRSSLACSGKVWSGALLHRPSAQSPDYPNKYPNCLLPAGKSENFKDFISKGLCLHPLWVCASRAQTSESPFPATPQGVQALFLTKACLQFRYKTISKEQQEKYVKSELCSSKAPLFLMSGPAETSIK